MTNQTKKLELLVVEDTPEFIEVAKKAYNTMDFINQHYVSTYEDAIQYLETNKVDVVVSDLFFPANTDYRQVMVEEMELGRQARLDDRESHWRYDIRSESLIMGRLERMKNEEKEQCAKLMGVKENPAGIEIARYCSEKRIPFVIASRADMFEKGDGYIVSHSTFLMHKLKDDLRLDLSNSNPFVAISVYGAERVDKKRTDTWFDCIGKAYKIKLRQEEVEEYRNSKEQHFGGGLFGRKR